MGLSQAQNAEVVLSVNEMSGVHIFNTDVLRSSCFTGSTFLVKYVDR